MDETLIQLSGWIVAFIAGIVATWKSFSAAKKDNMLIEVKEALKDNKVTTGEALDLVRRWIADHPDTPKQ